MTRHVLYDEFRKDPAKYMDEVGGNPLYIKRDAGSVVMMLESFTSVGSLKSSETPLVQRGVGRLSAPAEERP